MTIHNKPISNLSKSINELLTQTARYRHAMEQLFSMNVKTPRDYSRYFFNILLSVSALYVKGLTLAEDLQCCPISSRVANTDAEPHMKEAELRDHLRESLECIPWSYFDAESPFSKLTGLYAAKDYIHRFSLHLPEIYTETQRLDNRLRTFLMHGDARSRADLLVSLQHMGRNHISFVIQALEWASDRDSWNDE